jgi:hypothetical protein
VILSVRGSKPASAGTKGLYYKTSRVHNLLENGIISQGTENVKFVIREKQKCHFDLINIHQREATVPDTSFDGKHVEREAQQLIFSDSGKH